MMISPALIGLIAALLVFFQRYLFLKYQELIGSPLIFLLVMGVALMVFQRIILHRRTGNPRYDGLADLFYHIHSPFRPKSSLLWVMRASISFLLTTFGGSIGPEGVAIETIQFLNMRLNARSSLWFEQKRRTDVAVSLAAGISAAFGAPFASVLLPIELGIGGRSISATISALFAYLGIHFLMNLFSFEGLNVTGMQIGFHFSNWREWFGVIIIGIMAGLGGAGLIHFFRYSQESLSNLFLKRPGLKPMMGAILLCLVFSIYKPIHNLPVVLLEQVLWIKFSVNEVLLLCFAQVLCLALVIAAYGTIGVFWPLFVIGGYLGYCINHWILNDFIHFAAASALIGGAALWGAVLGIPVTGAVLVLELTQNAHILLPCFLAGLIARQCRQFVGTPTLIDKNLEMRGISMVGGRSTEVLDAVYVRDAMITDYEIVHEQETVATLYARLTNARYPFLPVVNTQGVFSGLLTIDLIQDAWKSPSSSRLHLGALVEAKDLVYRSGFRPPTVNANDRLLVVAKMFNESPCIPVLGEDSRVVGLLFGYNMRSAYDREVARRSFSFMGEGGNE